ncbi:MAG TPA: MobF family relaxase [Opitutaceae bacterium]|nr:MobF family relaxase [Lacunisphaera sp.]HWA09158.1 MobF family relaxase [Opitutaceae bacterium]
MIQPRIQFSLVNAKQYFREHLTAGDYYSQGMKVAGDWLGHGAAKLGLQGTVDEAAFLALCEGKNPMTGQKLGQRMNTVRQDVGRAKVANRRIFYDFVIAPPKSVSVVALYQDDRIVALHNEAVRQTMLELEKFAETRVRKAGANTERVTGNLVTACFRHDTSRELDPHLHTHCVVFNATFDSVENRWKGLQPAGMYHAKNFATNVYRHELCKGLRALGYEIANTAHSFEIKGVPASVIARFSKRNQQINEEAKQHVEIGSPVAVVGELRKRIAHGNRRRKLKDSTAERLRPAWEKQLMPGESKALDALRSVQPKPAKPADVAGITAWADEHLFERRSVVNDYELMSAALARGRGEDFDLAALREAIEQRAYIREGGTRKLTSREVLRCELGIVVAAHDGRNRHSPLSRDYHPAPTLSAEQATAAKQILASRNFITLFRGGAGTGKSFTLREVTETLRAAGHPVVVLAPQRQQVADLCADGLAAKTLSHCLEMKTLPVGAVVLVDEAGQIGGKQLGELVALVKTHGGRLILSGDTRQHGAVQASDALRAIEEFSGLKAAVLREIRRQDPARAKSEAERAFVTGYRKAVKAAAAGQTAESFDGLDRLGCIREVAPDDRRATLAREYLASVDRDECALVVAQTWNEVNDMNEAIRAELHTSGRIASGVVLKTYQAVDLNEAEKRDARFYQPGQFAYVIKRYGRFAKGDLCPIAGTNERGLVLIKDGRRSTMSYRHTHRLAIAVERETSVGSGDRLQLKFNGKSKEGRPIANGELVTVRRVAADGSLTVEDDRLTVKTLSPQQRLFNRGYAVTSYASQGKTVDTVLVADASCRAATNRNQWYVSISRGRKRVIVFTDNKAELRASIEQSGDRGLALEMKLSPPESSTHQGLRHRLPAWTRRALAATERVRLHEAVMRLPARNANRAKIAL